MKKVLITVILSLMTLSLNLYAQQDIQLGKIAKESSASGALYDYSDPNAVNIKVMVWGYVKFPGQYIIPATSNVINLLSLAGGPTQDAELDGLKLFRVNKDASQSIIDFNYEDLLGDNSDLSNPVKIPKLLPGDVLLVPGSPKWYFKDYFGLLLSVVSTLASIAAVLVYVYKK